MPSRISTKWTVQKFLKSNPESMPGFIQLKMNCVGCLMSRFCTLENAAQIYCIPIGELMERLEDPLQQLHPEERE